MVGQDVAALADDLPVAEPTSAKRALQSARRTVNGGEKQF